MTALDGLQGPRQAAAGTPVPWELLRTTTTPGKLRLLLVGLVVLSLTWGVAAALVVSQRAAGAADVVSTSEPLSLDGQQIYRALSDADATAATAFLSGGLEPIAVRHRYQADIAQAAARLEAATAIAGQSAAARDLATLSAELPVYTGEVETARADNRLGLPLGAAYLREASGLMRGTLLPAARDVAARADAQLAADSARATGLPLALVLLAVAIVVGLVLHRAQRWLSRRTHRVVNLGLLAASAAAAVSVLWLVIGLSVARAELLRAHDQGSGPVAALARADIAALQARTDESLTLIDGGGDDSFQTDFLAVQHRLGPGPGSLLTDAASAARGSPAAVSASAAASAATAWYAAHRTVRSLDNNGQHTQAVRLVITTGPGHSSTQFARLDAALTSGIIADQAAFSATAIAGRDAFTGLEAGVIALALVMAAGCARGLMQRLAEYR
ncbi:MAG TPA: hypothetical protein VNF47_19930 [Streptosporangiaceae bacterium]|nr:hypothetical protein [Streptosporangiaceae bacterium]